MSDPFLTAMGIIGEQDLTDELLLRTMRTLVAIFEGMDLEPTRRRLEAMVGLSMSPGEGLTSGEIEPWLDDAKSTIQWTYWDSYVRQLQSQGFTGSVLRTIDQDTDNILTECGNPSEPDPWRTQGLVMGDVQSGKTANYCGLISKAADSGYKVVVLLTGMIEELRSQSQERMDEGFVGQESSDLIEGVHGRIIGAGRFRDATPNVLTSVESDFLTANQRALRGIPLQNLGEPLLLVLKKNTTPLTRLIKYLQNQMRHGATQLDIPLFLVDDEADNASVNAKKDEDPAKINSLIRELMGQFRRAAYVGYTATPFANVFINPDPKRNDLFPNNFIYSLKAANTYIGAASIFLDDGAHAGQLVDIVDAEACFPDKHRKDLEIIDLPASMQNALDVFLLSCAVRDLREESLRHRTMLINVTRFTDVQGRLADVVDGYLFDLVNEIKQYLADDDLWSRHQPLSNLHKLYLEHYSDSGVPWDGVRKKLYDSVATVKVLTINRETEAEDKLNYRHYKNTEKGRRVIAIGGLTLSRGLTLEGLCVSYFYRNSKAYDTLLQMGRWFGYRPGYDDLCRIWMTPEAQDWFGHIAGVVGELRSDIRHMHLNRLPPSKFGIRVKSHPDILLVTAQNKMRHSEEVEVEASYSGRAVETSALPRSQETNQANVRVTTTFLNELGPADQVGSRYIWRNVSPSQVAAYLAALEISPVNQAFIPDSRTKEQPLLSFIADNEIDALQSWDVCLAQGSGEAARGIAFAGPDGVQVGALKRLRQFERSRSNGASFLKINKQRLGEISDEKVEIEEDVIREVEEAWRALDPEVRAAKRVPGDAYRTVRQRPLMTIHPVQPSDPDKDSKAASRIMLSSEIKTDLLIGVSLSFPQFEETRRSSVKYRLNKVYLRNAGLLDDEDESDEDLD
ncbi:Z1 domain-containing protein [Luteimonas sp. MC1825]|uniref:Z1 domain-containing protein n=1 Tax=Luteimonas sp. MC1825 TaxID=2761107 RepID=UPI00160CB127|nr:Z1 domain-containing protein [Luteimonas sp. MC1825]MBB6599610.1 Z1 domain-containing protein [Luteimonas sp. MC1825]QOC87302.1 Z1 domain-containing protein [Luteimonas sp. MC1825]